MNARHRLAFALRGPIDRLQLPGTRLVVERLLAGATGMRDVTLSSGVRMRVDLGARVERLEAFRAYERRELALMRDLLRPGDTMLDVGAHVGYYAVHAAPIVGASGAVHAFDPVPSNAARMRENAALNGFRWMHVVQAAVSAEPGRTTFGAVEIPGESGWGSLVFTAGEDIVPIDVEVVTVDGYARAQGIGRVAFMKIDVQGNELDVMHGAREVLERDGPDVLTEADLFCTTAAGHTPEEVIGFMRTLGYRSWAFPPRGRPVRFEGTEPPSLNLFFAHRDRLERP